MLTPVIRLHKITITTFEIVFGKTVSDRSTQQSKQKHDAERDFEQTFVFYLPEQINLLKGNNTLYCYRSTLILLILYQLTGNFDITIPDLFGRFIFVYHL